MGVLFCNGLNREPKEADRMKTLKMSLIYLKVFTRLIIMWSAIIGPRSSVVINTNNRKRSVSAYSWKVISCSHGVGISGWLGSAILKDMSVSGSKLTHRFVEFQKKTDFLSVFSFVFCRL